MMIIHNNFRHFSALKGLVCFALIAIPFLSACDRELGAPPKFNIEDQQQYFPLFIGHSITYQCDSIVYDFEISGSTLKIASTTFIQERTTDTLLDNTGQLTYTIERYERKAETDPWLLTKIWLARQDNTQAIRIEDNLTFIRLIYPMDRRSEWDGNVLIDANREIEIAGERMRPFVNWRYEVDSIDIAQQIGAFAFDSVLVITEVDETNVIERRLSRSKYAKGKGLVWREQWILDSQYCNAVPAPTDCETKPWDQKAERGYILRQVIVEQ